MDIFENHKSLKYNFDKKKKKKLNLRRRRLLKLIKDNNCFIEFHLGKDHIVVDAMNRKLDFLRVRCGERVEEF